MSVRQLDVPFIQVVHPVTTLRGFQIHIRHLRVLSNRLPEHISLIVRQVDAMHVRAGVFTLQEGVKVGIIQSGVDRCDLLHHLDLRFLMMFEMSGRMMSLLVSLAALGTL